MRPGAETNEVLDRKRLLGKLTDRNRRPRQSERRDNRVHTAAVRQTSVNVRLRLVAATPERCDDALNDRQHRGVVGKLAVGENQLATALDEDLVWSVDHDFTNRIIGQQLFKRPQPHRLIKDILLKPNWINAGRKLAVRHHLVDNLTDLRASRIFKRVLIHALNGQTLHIHALQQLPLNLLLDVLPHLAHRVYFS